MLKDIWNTITGNYRYIKYDGSQFHRKKGWSILDRPETKVGLACVAFNCVSAAFLNHDISHILNGDFLQISTLTKESLTTNLSDFAIGFTMTNLLLNPMIINNRFPKKNKAIDTFGTELSRAPLSLKDIQNLESTRKLGAMLSAIYFCSMAIELFSNDANLSVPAAMYLTTSFMAFERSSKILNGKYVICDDPPKKRERAKRASIVYGGIRSPN